MLPQAKRLKLAHTAADAGDAVGEVILMREGLPDTLLRVDRAAGLEGLGRAAHAALALGDDVDPAALTFTVGETVLAGTESLADLGLGLGERVHVVAGCDSERGAQAQLAREGVTDVAAYAAAAVERGDGNAMSVAVASKKLDRVGAGRVVQRAAAARRLELLDGWVLPAGAREWAFVECVRGGAWDASMALARHGLDLTAEVEDDSDTDLARVQLHAHWADEGDVLTDTDENCMQHRAAARGLLWLAFGFGLEVNPERHELLNTVLSQGAHVTEGVSLWIALARTVCNDGDPAEGLMCGCPETRAFWDPLLAKMHQDLCRPMLEHAPASLLRDREFVLFVIAEDYDCDYDGLSVLAIASDELQADREVVLAAVSQYGRGHALEYAADELRADREVVLAAIKESSWAFEHAADELRADREFVLAAVSLDGFALENAADELRADREVVLAAVSQDGRALKYAADELRADREVVLAAVSQHGRALKHAADELRADREVVLAELSQHGFALKHAADELRADREVVLAAVSQYGRALEHAADELRADREVVLAAVSLDGFALEHAADELRADREVVLAAVSQNSGALKYACPSLQRGREVMAAARPV